MATYSKDRDVNKIVQNLIAEGWTPQKKTKHWQICPPNGGKPLTVPNTPSDGRAMLNFKADIKRSKGESYVK